MAQLDQDKSEQIKRKREIISIFVLSIILAILVGVEVFVFRSGQSLPSPYVIYFIALVNFNLVLVLLLLFLIFRNLVKVFIERRGKIFGSSLKSKLIIAFATFSVIPTTLVLVLSVFYLNSSFDKWFSQRMIGIMKNASEVIDSFIVHEKRNSYEYADYLAQKISENQLSKKKLTSRSLIEKFQSDFKIDAVEFYSDLYFRDAIAINSKIFSQALPKVSFDFLQKGFLNKSRLSYIHIFGESHLMRVMVPVSSGGVVVVSKVLNLAPGAKLDDIVGAYQEFQSNSIIENPLKSIYFIMQTVMSLVILFAAIWFGFHLAKQLSVPLVQLGRATKRVAGGDYTHLEIQSGSAEIQSLIENFNQMISNLSHSEVELQQTLKNLNQYTRYVEIVLRNVSAGVLSVDSTGHVTTMNRRAAELLNLKSEDIVGKNLHLSLASEYAKFFTSFMQLMKENQLSTLQKEIRLDVQRQNEIEAIPLSVHVSLLKNELNEEIGYIIVFDDMTPIVNAQRAAAWSEVARRIAHEIKNPLTPIRLAAERISRKYSDQIQDQAFKDSIQMIVTQVDDMRNLVNEFAQFARMPQLKAVPGSINELLGQMMSTYRANHPEVQFFVELDQKIPEFKFDSAQLKRVFVNLIDNAIHATENLVKNQQQADVTLQTEYLMQHQVVRIFIIDNGIGIPARDRQRVFEPYFSTKEKGTGLGLPIVKSIIEDHNGVIRALGHEPHGTKMMIELPIS